MNSWDKMLLGHVNRVVTLYQNGEVVALDALIINIDLINGRIIYRQDKGEGIQATIFGGAIRIEDSMNYRPGKTEYNQMHGIDTGRSPEELIRSY